MFHHSPLRRSAVALTLLAVMSGLPGDGSLPAQAQHPYVPASEQTLSATVASGLKAYDESPLGNRIPVVLVHGIGGTATRLFHWEHFLETAERNEEFNQKYKIYLYHYDSTRSVPAISHNLQRTLKDFITRLDGRDIKILAYSEGGLLVRNALQDSYLDENTIEVLAIATPFHGSPLANPEWLGEQVQTESPFSLVRLTQKAVYEITGRRYPTFREDFRWDNFDGAIPADRYLKLNGPAAQVNYSLARKANFTTYGSYFGLEVDPEVLPRELSLEVAPPKEKPMPANLFRKNFLFSMIRNNIGKLPLAHKKAGQIALKVKGRVLDKQTEPVQMAALAENAVPVMAAVSPGGGAISQIVLPAVNEVPADVPKVRSVRDLAPEPSPTPTAEPVSMMMFNDGISPISSTLWLGRFTPRVAGVQQPVEKLWSALRSLKGNRNTRLFAGLDHRNWMDGVTRTGEDKVQDLLNPDQKSRTVFEWILFDLMS